MAQGNPRCTNTRYHDSHRYSRTVTKNCPGSSPCGWVGHPPHDYTVTEALWCPGICDCGLTETYGYAAVHGPGEHK